MIFRKLLYALFRLIDRVFVSKLRRHYHLANLPQFGRLGANTVVMPPFRYGNPQLIRIGQSCRIGDGCDFGVVVSPSGNFDMGKFQGEITIGDRVWITKALQIFSAVSVSIGDDVLIASNAFFCDVQHGYSSASVPYKDQHYEKAAPIVIGKGSWIGQNVVVMSGVTIGEYAIVGANSLSPLELFKLLEEIGDCRMRYASNPCSESDQRGFVADITKANRLLGWVPQMGAREGCGDDAMGRFHERFRSSLI